MKKPLVKIEDLADLRTPEQIILYTFTKLLKQGRQSISKDHMCKYRTVTPRRLACGVGWLIPDSAYDEENFEGREIGRLAEHCKIQIAALRQELPAIFGDLKLLTDIQSCHDDADKKSFRKSLVSLYSIKFPEFKEKLEAEYHKYVK